MTAAKRGVPSLSRLLMLSQKAAAAYADGDLSRVEVDVDDDEGMYVVVVLPSPAAKGRVRPTAKKAAAALAGPKSGRAPAEPSSTSTETLPKGPTEEIRNGMRVIQLPPVLPPRRAGGRKAVSPDTAPREAPGPAIAPATVPGSSGPYYGDTDEDLGKTAYDLTQTMKKGIPGHYVVRYHAEVESAYGIDREMTEATLYFPQSVEIATEMWDKNKRYPILIFRRGDVRSVVSFRTQNSPYVMAVYPTTGAYQNYKSAKGSTGGGGARKEAGVPRTPGTLVSRIEGMGAVVKRKGDVADVTYQGQDLGKIEIKNGMTRPMVEQNWQRIQRKVNAINQKVSSQR